MGEHPHDCPPECRACERDDAYEALCDELDCDTPVVDVSGEYNICGQCARCEDANERFMEAIALLEEQWSHRDKLWGRT